MEASLAPTNLFLEVRQAPTRPYKSILGVRQAHTHPYKYFFNLLWKII